MSVDTPEKLEQEVVRLRQKLAETRATIEAMHAGEVDAIVVTTSRGEHVYTLSGAEHPYRVMIEEMQQGAVTLGVDGTILYANRCFLGMLRAAPGANVLGRPISDFLTRPSRHFFEALLRQRHTGRAQGEVIFIGGAGVEISAYVSVSVLPSESVEALCVIVTDLTQQKRHRDLVASEELSRSILEQSVDAVVVCDEDGRVIRANAEAHRFCESNPMLRRFEEAFPLRYGPVMPTSSVPTETRAGDRVTLEPILAGRVITVAEVVLSSTNRETPTLLLSAGPLRRPGRRIQGAVIILTDVTERIRAQDALSESEARFREIAANIREVLWMSTPDRARTLYMSPRFEEVFGSPVHEMVASDRTFAERIHPEDRERVQAAWRLQSLRGYDETFRIVRPDGGVRWVWDRAFPITDPDGRVSRLVGVLEDVTERRRHEEEREHLLAERERQRELLETLVESAPIGIGVLRGPELRFFLANSFYRSLTPEPEEPLAGRALAEVFPAMPSELLDKIRQAIASGERLSLREARVESTPGRDECWWNLECVPLRSGSGDDAEALVLCQDVTEARASREDLRQSKEAAEEANRAKSRFLANISHELRTPMNAILGMTELALDENLSESARDYVSTARGSADFLLTLLNEILDFSRIESGRMSLESTPFRLRPLVYDALRTFDMRAWEKGIEVIVDVDRCAPEHLIGDPLRLRQVLANLVGNAIKFTEQGEVVVRVRAAPTPRAGSTPCAAPTPHAGSAPCAGPTPHAGSTPECPELDATCLEFSVSDTGIGIAPEYQARIFTPFTQADASTTRHYGGTGLGLSIAASIVSMMEGRIWLDSEPGRGSTFFFSVGFGVQPGFGGAGEHAASEVLRDLRVLVADDNPTSRSTVEHLCRGLGMRPETSPGGEDVLRQLRLAVESGDPFRVVLLDAIMPGLDGMEIARRIHNEPRIATTVVHTLTATERQMFADRWDRVGSAGWLEKPVSETGLVDVLLSAFHRRDAERRTTRPAGPTEIPAASRRLRVLLAEDSTVNQKLMVILLNRRGHQVDVAENGREAVDLARGRDYDVILMDVQMPIMDGLQATAAIRDLDDPDKSAVPIVAMTAHAMPEDRRRCLDVGMNGYMAKPIDVRSLIEVVEGIAKGESPAVQDPAPSEFPTDSPAGSSYDPVQALARLGGKRDLLRQLVDLVLEDAPNVLAKIRNALAADDLLAMEREAHGLRGMVAYLSAGPSKDAAATLEKLARARELGAASDAFVALEREVLCLLEAMSKDRADGAV